MQQLSWIQGEVSRVYGGQHRPEPTAPERGAGEEEKEAWKEDCDEDERMANGWYENAAHGSIVDPAEGSDDVGGSLGRSNPSTPRIGARARDTSRSLQEKKVKESDKWEMKGSREAGWREVSGRREKRRKNSQGKDPRTFEENSPGKDPRTFEENIEHLKQTASERTREPLKNQ